MAGAFAMFISLFLTPAFIWAFRRLEWGQFIRDDGPKTHHTKRGTPTMGGLVILFAAVVSYFTAKLINGESPSMSALLVIFMMLGLGGLDSSMTS